MIASLNGTVQKVGLDSLVIGVGGVGMLVHTTPATATSVRLGEEATLATTLVVREDSLTLYGFATDDEKHVFETVQTVSGVGPRLALALLAVLPPEKVRVALGTGDVAALTKVPGIGKKGAERLVLELRDKLGALATTTTAAGAATTSPRAAAPWREQVHEALVGLGWTARQAEDALDKVAPQAADGVGVSALLKAALLELGR
jgi:Holliday junction DNA helicase RuvA